MNFVINTSILWLIITEVIAICIAIALGICCANEESSIFKGILLGIAILALLQFFCFSPWII